MKAVILGCLVGAMPALAQPVALLQDRVAGARPQLMVVGVPHFGNPGRDIANSQVPDVRTPARQAELERLAAALAQFRPTHVVVEYPSDRQARLDARYADYRAGRYVLTADETDQLGLRLAARLRLPRVDALDWNGEPPGQARDYDFQRYAAGHGQQARVQALAARGQRQADAESARMPSTSVAAWLREVNSAAYRAADERVYFDYAMIGDAADGPGANWVADWYGRNLKIFAGLVRLAARDDDRVLVIYGAGHGAPLADYARTSGAFTVVDPMPLLEQAR